MSKNLYTALWPRKTLTNYCTTADELLSGNMLNVHGEDYAEKAFQRKLRLQ